MKPRTKALSIPATLQLPANVAKLLVGQYLGASGSLRTCSRTMHSSLSLSEALPVDPQGKEGRFDTGAKRQANLPVTTEPTAAELKASGSAECPLLRAGDPKNPKSAGSF
ncbi:hypothetical protein MN608_05577 [Microdochium nivale]|nr:hypothetical protein MN608_05577 [Microdochium nivale]